MLAGIMAGRPSGHPCNSKVLRPRASSRIRQGEGPTLTVPWWTILQQTVTPTRAGFGRLAAEATVVSIDRAPPAASR